MSIMYYKKIILTMVCIVVFAVAIQFERSGLSTTYGFSRKTKVVTNTMDAYASEKPSFEQANKKLLVIYDATDEVCVRYQQNIAKNLEYMGITHECIQAAQLGTVTFSDYSSVVMLVQDLENKLGEPLYALIDYVEAGGNLLIGIAPSHLGSKFYSVYRKFGITEVSGYVDIDGIKFLEDVIPEVKYRSFCEEDNFGENCIQLRLDDSCKVYIESYGKVKGNPLLWKRQLGEGNIVFYNAGSLGGKYYSGVFAGTVGILEETLLYPIINAKVVFIDDFPAPQYDVENTIISKEYNRSVKNFYRDIWWPDMQKLSKLYNCAYTCLFVATYNDIVDPTKFVFEDDSTMRYYGKSLLRSGFELGLHGYNHQSLVPKGYLPQAVGYVPWATEEAMMASLKALSDYGKTLFPNAEFTSYVPPSNYLSPMGRSALYKALPNLQVISGVYVDTEEEGEYVKDYMVADDGIVEFPRMTSGMNNNDATVFACLNGLALHGVFSHFIHPDDILNKERGMGKNWEQLKEGYAGILDDTNKKYSVIRPLTATQAADAVRVYDKLELQLAYSDQQVLGYCGNFSGEAFFYLRTQKEPVVVDESCTIVSIGDSYYLVTVKQTSFKIKLRN